MYLFDSDHLAILQHRTSPECQRILARMQAYADEDFFVPVVSFHEQMLGWHTYISRAKDSAGLIRGYQRMQKILTDFSEAQVLAFDKGAAEEYDRLLALSLRVGSMDLRIAAIALSHDFTLLTRNFTDFSRIPNLRFEDWTS